MTARSEHLIERAAAKLREANVVAVPAEPPAPLQEHTPASSPFQPFVVPSAVHPQLPANGPAAEPIGRVSSQQAGADPAKPVPRSNPANPPPSDAATPQQAEPERSEQTAPVLRLDALERAGMVVARRTRTRISEEYRIAIGRILRTLHEAAGPEGAGNVLMVTSARPGEGKSFTAINLAGSIAQNGPDHVLLVDVDPKLKPLSDKLGLADAGGFLDLVADPTRRPEDLILSSAIPNLSILPIGNRSGGSAHASDEVAAMRPIMPVILDLARRLPKHLIVLDAPPCLSTSDPHTIAPHVGQIVMVVEAERTQRAEVEAAIDLIRACPSITMLLNKVRMTTSHTFGAYDYFGSYT